jgi:hypothetical protein
LPAAYNPGALYSLTVTVNDSGNKFGFEITSIDNLGAPAGNFQTNASTQLKTTNILGNLRQYILQRNSFATSSNTWTFNWTAPNPSAGTVAFYMSGLRANNDSNLTLDTLFNATNTLAPASAPNITTHPQSRTVAQGSNATLMVVASGAPTPTYQWRTNGVNFAGRTASSVTVTNFQAGNEAGYDVVVANSVGSVTSSIALLYLNSPLRFTNLTSQQNVHFSALLIGAANTNYVIDAAANLTNWTAIRTNASATGLINFTDTNVNNGGRFYRARRQ